MSIAPDAARIRQRLAGTREPADPLDVDVAALSRRMPDDQIQALLPALRPAGVLIPLIERGDSLSVLLTERSSQLKHHAGQVSFPGGGMEPHDASITATALRETHEEVGIAPAAVEVAGYLNPTPTVTGFAVTPVVGFVSGDPELIVDRTEAETAFEVPLDFLMDERNEVLSEQEHGGIMFRITTFHYDGHKIWGATAGIIATFRELIV